MSGGVFGSQYGDAENVVKDALKLIEIFERQGPKIFFDVIADQVGEAALKFTLDAPEIVRVRDSYLKDFRYALLERT